MDTRSSSLVVGLYLLAAIAVGAIVAGVFFGRPSRLEEELARQAAEAEKAAAGGTSYLRRNAISRQEFLASAAAAEVERLRRQLDEKNRLLEDRTSSLKQRTAAYQKLQQDYEAAASLVLQSLGSPPAEANSPDLHANAGEATSALAEPATTDAAALREELNKARLLENALSEEVEQLQAEVLAAETAIARLQQNAQRQADQLLADERLMREVAGETLVRIGEPAIPVLVEALQDENPTVRRWAAMVLADLGPAAPGAIGPLMDALADSDESVRLAAAQALRAVTERE